MEQVPPTNDYSKISPTAKLVAYYRSLSDIPYAQEMAQATDAASTAHQIMGDALPMLAVFSPLIMEARYKAIDQGIQRTGLQQVLELACGLSTRGLTIAAAGGRYVGTDLPELLAATYPVLKCIALENGVPSNETHYLPVNVLYKEQLQQAVALFNGHPLVVCNEGLLMYLTHEEKATMATHLHQLLLPVQGCWVTTDLVFGDIRKQLMDALPNELKGKLQSVLSRVSGQVGRDIIANDFASEAAAKAFYNNLGFEVETYPFYDGSYPLSTLSLIPADFRHQVVDVLSAASSWILTPKK